MEIKTQAEYLFNRLSKRHRHLKKWAKRTGTNAFRLYDRDIPEIPLTLDLYGDAVSGAVYLKNGINDDHGETEWIYAMKEAASKALDIPTGNIFLKERMRMRNRQETGIQYSKLPEKNIYRDVKEGDFTFRVNLSDYLDTGLFLDARKKRAVIRSEAAGKRVLNLFAYTCSLSIAAAKGDAVHVDSVDLSNTYLSWGRINFALNRLEKRSGSLPLIRGDVLQFVNRAVQKKNRWDLIILDPPSFSNSKKMKGTLDIKRDHGELIKKCLLLLSPGGTLWFSSGAKGLKLDNDSFPGFSIKDIGRELVDEDFRGKRIPVCYKISAAPYAPHPEAPSRVDNFQKLVLP